MAVLEGLQVNFGGQMEQEYFLRLWKVQVIFNVGIA